MKERVKEVEAGVNGKECREGCKNEVRERNV